MHGTATRGRLLDRLGMLGGEPAIHIPRLALVLATVWSASGLVLAAVAAAASVTGRPVADFTREPVAALEETTCAGADCAYIGFLSNAGLLVWAGTAAVSLLAGFLSRNPQSDRGLAAPFLAFGLLTTVLASDDAFQIHELVAPALIDRGESLLIGAYALVLAGLLVRYRSFVLRTDFGLLLVSGALFLVSAALDHWLPGLHLLEDGSKFVGIATWATWLVGTAIAVLRASAGRADPAA
jgi:hypothetical protein